MTRFSLMPAQAGIQDLLLRVNQTKFALIPPLPVKHVQ